VIIGLGGWVYSEYLNNPYFQSYMNSLSPILVPVVSVGFGIISATVATLLYFTMRNIREQEGGKKEDLASRRGPAKKTARKPQVSSSRNEKAVTGSPALVSRPKLFLAGQSKPKRGASQENSDEDESA
jgi:hypothetical protein